MVLILDRKTHRSLEDEDKETDTSRMETIARPHPTKEGVYLLSGSKTWITNSPIGLPLPTLRFLLLSNTL
jgi:hypothetical protein